MRTTRIKPTIKATSRTTEGPAESDEADAVEPGEAAGSAEAAPPGTGVAPHGSFNPLAPETAAGLPPALKDPLTVIT
ncbi:MAG: hypothetical protein ACFN4K_06665 [Pauljensenia sp.]